MLTTDKTATTAAAATDVPQNSDVPADGRKGIYTIEIFSLITHNLVEVLYC